MIIGIVGKGGSGKSTVATMLARELHRDGNHVLAIDADHNMDMAYTLSGRELPSPYIGEALYDIRHRFGLADTDPFSSTAPSSIAFTVDPVDDFTAAYSHPHDDSKRPKMKTDICMDKKEPDADHDIEEDGSRRVKTQKVRDGDGDKEGLDWMLKPGVSKGTDGIQVRIRMMKGMHRPEPGEPMLRAVIPIEDKVPREHSEENDCRIRDGAVC
jgi:energy-coupling factor transporter ATP-binding protein EcfA2